MYLGNLVIVALLAIPVLVGSVFIVRYVLRRRYVAELTAHGWTFVETPSPRVAWGLNRPPFGLGRGREVDDQIIGRTAGGREFQCFEYRCDAVRVPGHVVTMRLPHSLPEFYVVPTGGDLPGVTGTQIADHPAVVTSDVAFGQQAWASIRASLDAFPTPVTLTVDHDQVVALGAPRDAEELASFLERLAPIADALSSPGFGSFAGEQPPAELSVHHHPDWVYRRSDDSALDLVEVTGGGTHHAASDVLFGDARSPISFVALTHTWQTTHTETTTTNGQTHTRTVTDHHSEEVTEFHPSFRFPPFSVNRGWFGEGKRRTFESVDFDREFTVRCDDAKFASDLFHPQTMSYLLATRPYPFRVDERGAIQMDVPNQEPATLAACLDFLEGFFGRVPDFVWQNIGIWPRPIDEVIG